MTTATFLARLGAVMLGASGMVGQAAPGEVPGSGGSADTKRTFEGLSGAGSGETFDVPLLQFPAFLDAAAAKAGGARTLLQPPSDTDFARSLGAQFWMPTESGWSRPRDGSLLDEGISFTSVPMSDGPALPVIRPLVSSHLQMLTGDGRLFTEASQVPGGFIPTRQLGWATGGSSGSWLGGLFLMVAFVALLLSQLRGFEKAGRRRRSSSRRRRH